MHCRNNEPSMLLLHEKMSELWLDDEIMPP